MPSPAACPIFHDHAVLDDKPHTTIDYSITTVVAIYERGNAPNKRLKKAATRREPPTLSCSRIQIHLCHQSASLAAVIQMNRRRPSSVSYGAILMSQVAPSWLIRSRAVTVRVSDDERTLNRASICEPT